MIEYEEEEEERFSFTFQCWFCGDRLSEERRESEAKKRGQRRFCTDDHRERDEVSLEVLNGLTSKRRGRKRTQD